ncbi:MAG: excinuclease ABC subunit UvrC [SAR202 cluster bacterium]|nr:excinuclease ABC subunit UvrC [SAR202 cluster bacterium]
MVAIERMFDKRLRATPTQPGVYLMRDGSGSILYVGKAASLRHRLSSYFASPAGLPPKIRRMVNKLEDFEFIVTESEQEALILECNLIKEHQPPYNARLKDDKSYPFIKLDLTEEYPLVYVTRKVANDGARYFGPYANATSVRRTLAVLKKLFPYRSCTKAISGSDDRACLDYYIHRCAGPCIGAVGKSEYGEIIDEVAMFLEGKTDAIVKGIQSRMEEAAEGLEFERAAALRDQIQAIEKVHEGQKVLHLTSENVDIIAAAQGKRESWVEVFFIRQGKLIGRDNFLMHSTPDDDMDEVMSAFIKQFYDATPYVPPKIIVHQPISDSETIAEWLTEKRQSKVQIHVPQRGEKRKLAQMVADNASQSLEQLTIRRIHEETNNSSAMEELQEALSLPSVPRRIECYDISNIQGTNSVGSMVVFEDGKPKTSHYRRFKIKTVEGPDDYSSMKEVLTRRFKRLSESRNVAKTNGSGQESENGAKSSEPWGIIPDLVIIDGGKGHVGAALQVFLELGIDDVPLSSLAKENEELFVPHSPEGIVLPRNAQSLFLVQRVRDEAHRFAITFHRQRRSKQSIQSAMDLVPGIGPKRKRMLMRKFGSLKGIREAQLEDIAAVPGMTMKAARALKSHI